MPSVSVIIPVFNSERYIGRCLDSVLGQRQQDIEVICVNDKSSDGTLSVLYQRAEADPRLKVVDLERNLGPGNARNVGIDVSKGEFLYFIDSDDWIEPDYLSSMLFEITSTGQDVVVNPEYIEEYESFSLKHQDRDIGYWIPGPGFHDPRLVQALIPPLVVLRLYRRSYLMDNNIRFPVCRAGEDVFFSGLAEVLQKRSYIFHGPKYHYLQRKQSLVRQEETCLEVVKNFKALFEAVVGRGLSVNGMKLFQAGLRLNVSSENAFLLLRDYCKEISDFVEGNVSLYNGFDRFVINALLKSVDYHDFISTYGARPALMYVRRSYLSHHITAT